MFFQPPAELHIFHERYIHIPAATEVKFPLDEQSMVTRCNTRQAATPVHEPGNDTKDRVRVRKLHVKPTPQQFGPCKCLDNHLCSVGWQVCVCMKKQKNIAFAMVGTTAQLMATRGSGAKDSAAKFTGDIY